MLGTLGGSIGFGSLLQPAIAKQIKQQGKRVCLIWLDGGISQYESWHPLPQSKFAGPFRSIKTSIPGIRFSELMPHLSRHADDLCIVRSVHCDQIEHSGAIRQMTTGDGVLPRPSVGAWALYGLGSENDSLPGFVSISRQSNLAGKVIHGSSFLPAAFEGTSIPDVKKPIENLSMPVPREIQATRLAAIRRLAAVYRRRREDDSRLDARLAAYELAFRMQTRAPEAFDLSRESRTTQDLYGLGQKDTDEYGRQCLLARRLVERGVRFVVANVDNQWDAHGNVRDHEKTSRQTDRPVAALIADLKSRGLLDQTLVVWGGEFGRTPTGQGGGRDHHPYGFTMWLAGGGVRGGMTYGATDDFGFFAVEDKVHVHDLHATMLHLIGLDHEALTYRYSGRDFRLTDVYGRVVSEILA